VRAGPPPAGRGGRRDLAIGIVGLLLMAAAGGLVEVLPETDVLLPQFRVTVVPIVGEVGSYSGAYLSGAQNDEDHMITLTRDNVFQFSVIQATAEDDVCASFADRIEFTLHDLEDNPILTWMVATPDPVLNTNNSVLGEYECSPGGDQQRLNLYDPPQDSIVTGLTGDETAVQVEERLMAEYHLPTAGDWRLHASLDRHGDCPLPQIDPHRAASCQQESSGGADPDPGNTWVFNGLTYSYFLLDVEEIE
jgi:hypothetical protein